MLLGSTVRDYTSHSLASCS